MPAETTELRRSDTCAAVMLMTLETARAAIAGLGEAAPTGAVRGLDIAISDLDQEGATMAQVVSDLKLRARNLHNGDSYRRQCAHALTFAATLIEIFLEG